MNVSLTPELERLVHLKVQTGRYASASEVVREALRMMEARDQVLHKDEFREKIAVGMASLRAGLGADGEDFLAAMDAELAKLEQREPNVTRYRLSPEAQGDLNDIKQYLVGEGGARLALDMCWPKSAEPFNSSPRTPARDTRARTLPTSR